MMARSRVDTRSPKASGEEVEARVIQHVDELRSVPDATAEWHDAVVEGALTPSDDVLVGGTVLLERGTYVEIKAAQRRLASGQRGRYNIRQGQHERLLDAAGAYLLAVYEPGRTHRVLAMLVTPASLVDELLPDGWLSYGEGRSCRYRQLGWARVIAPEHVDGEGGAP